MTGTRSWLLPGVQLVAAVLGCLVLATSRCGALMALTVAITIWWHVFFSWHDF
ncbi:hypothetical protein [Nocardioides sp.]|uniref:hypothetical protein n=1 Tax=Nocardioides sp. TaxID=35761 RepID=UPI003D124D07